MSQILFLSTQLIFLWNSKVPTKIRVFAWLVTYKKVNTNDMLQLRRPFKALSPGGAFFVGVERQLIISSYIVRLLWDCGIEFFHRLRWNGFNLAVFAICWWFRLSALGILLKARLFGGSRLSLLWIVWRKRNARIFEDIWKTLEMMWDQLHFYVSFRVYCTNIFKPYPLSVIQLS